VASVWVASVQLMGGGGRSGINLDGLCAANSEDSLAAK